MLVQASVAGSNLGGGESFAIRRHRGEGSDNSGGFGKRAMQWPFAQQHSNQRSPA